MTCSIFSFVIVTYNNADTIGPCLQSIVAHTADLYEIAVVDNSPGQETILAVESFRASHPDVAVRLIRPDTNVGFSRACNLGASLTTGKYLFFLNPDTALMNDAAGVLAGCLEQYPTALAAGPAIFDSEGRVTPTCRNLPTLGRIVLDATGMDRWWGAYRLIRFSHQEPRPVEQIIGAAMLLHRRVYESAHGMDEQFFIYFEEVDLCKRLRDSGGEVWFWPKARVQHLAGRSCEVESVHARMIFILRDSRKKYFRKHYGVLGAVALEAINRVEALQKSLVLAFLWMLWRKRSDLEKAHGFLTVAFGVAPRV
jgi:N-acetylglucosaminyl-diphospho-decaprenol L-rhamnosyltransferase